MFRGRDEFELKGGSDNVKKQADKPKPVLAAAVTNRQPTLPSEKGFAKSAGRGRGVLVASNSAAPGKPLGAMEQIKLLEQKALAEQQQLQLQKTKPPPPAKKKGIIGSLKDLMKKTPPPPKPEEKDEKAKAKKKKPVTPVAVSSLANIEAKLVHANTTATK